MPVIKVIECDDNELPYTGEGKVINSPLLNGLDKKHAIEKVIKHFKKEGIEIKVLQIKGLGCFKTKILGLSDTGNLLRRWFLQSFR